MLRLNNRKLRDGRFVIYFISLFALFTPITLSAQDASPSATAKETITYIHVDNLGSPIAATTEEGEVKWLEDYRPYGDRNRYPNHAEHPNASLLIDETKDNNIWFTGYVEDKDVGLSYANARWYNPVIGRFISMDPVAVQAENTHSFNRYAYANNNPYRYVDPDGENPFLVYVAYTLARTAIQKAASWAVKATATAAFTAATEVAVTTANTSSHNYDNGQVQPTFQSLPGGKMTTEVPGVSGLVNSVVNGAGKTAISNFSTNYYEQNYDIGAYDLSTSTGYYGQSNLSSFVGSIMREEQYEPIIQPVSLTPQPVVRDFSEM